MREKKPTPLSARQLEVYRALQALLQPGEPLPTQAEVLEEVVREGGASMSLKRLQDLLIILRDRGYVKFDGPRTLRIVTPYEVAPPRDGGVRLEIGRERQ